MICRVLGSSAEHTSKRPPYLGSHEHVRCHQSSSRHGGTHGAPRPNALDLVEENQQDVLTTVTLLQALPAQSSRELAIPSRPTRAP